MSGPKNALAAWSSSALRPVELPTGTRALVKLPNVPALLAAGAFPQELRTLAAKYASSGIEVAKLEEEEIGRFLSLTYDLIARALKYLAPRDSQAWDAFQRTGDDPSVEGWEPISLTGAELLEHELDQDDIAALGQIVGRQTSTAAITFASRLERGLVDDQAKRVEGGDDPTIEGMKPFRRQSGGDVRGPDSEDVRGAPVGAARTR